MSRRTDYGGNVAEPPARPYSTAVSSPDGQNVREAGSPSVNPHSECARPHRRLAVGGLLQGRVQGSMPMLLDTMMVGELE